MQTTFINNWLERGSYADIRRAAREFVAAAAAASARVWRRFGREDGGNSAVEFALIIPVLATIMIGTLKFSLVMNQQVTLNQGVDAAARFISTCRNVCNVTVGSTTTSEPYTQMMSYLDSATTTLVSTTVNPTITVTMFNAAGTTDVTGVSSGQCGAGVDSTSNDSTCTTALSTDGGGGRVTVKGTYPCDLQVLSVNFAPNCTLSASTTAIIE
jgi:Flp pilus assembly protein TadG